MEYLANLFAAWPLGRRRTRLGRFQDERERIAVSAPLSLTADQSLSAHIPSSLVPMEQRIRALAVGGAPAWSRRLKQIHDLQRAAAAQLAHNWRRLAERRRRHPERFAAEWREHAEHADLRRVNDLIARHNQYFPVEFNLPMDVRTRDYVSYNGGDYRLPLLDAAWVLDRFPAKLAVALGHEDDSDA